MSESATDTNRPNQYSVREIERALAAADIDEGADDTPYWTGRMEAVEIIRDMLGLTEAGAHTD